MITAMVKPVFGILLPYPPGRGLDGGLHRLAGRGLGRAQPNFKFAEGKFDRIKIRRIGQQIQ